MRNVFIIIATIAFIIGAFYIHSAMAESKAETYLGAPKTYLSTSEINETVILDDQTILFKMLNGKLYINRLPFECPNLITADGFAYTTSIAKIYKQDIITALWPDFTSGSKCGLGYFWPFKYQGKTNGAVTLLKNGLLDKLVAEGAFKKVSPDNK
jgi:hypothetical protein